jgi:hypothetical protein
MAPRAETGVFAAGNRLSCQLRQASARTHSVLMAIGLAFCTAFMHLRFFRWFGAGRAVQSEARNWTTALLAAMRNWQPQKPAFEEAAMNVQRPIGVVRILALAGWALLLATPSADAAEIYWADERGIHRAAGNGSNAETLFNQQPFAIQIAVDANSGQLFWSEWGPAFSFDDKIRRLDLTTRQVTDVLSNITIDGLTLDTARQEIYWAGNLTPGFGGVLRADYSGAQTAFVADPWLDDSLLYFDALNQKLYRRDTDNDRIDRSNLDGTQEEMLDFPSLAFSLGDANSIYAFSTSAELVRAAPDASEKVILATYDQGFPSARHVAVDPIEGKIYFADYFDIYRANLDGSMVELILDRGEVGDFISSLVVVPVPEPSSFILVAFGGFAFAAAVVAKARSTAAERSPAARRP